MKVLKNSKGFTLVEMLIVMAVAVVLSAAAIPSVTGQVEKAREANDLVVIADAYADAYAQAAVQASTGATTDIEKSVGIVLQQLGSGWTVVTTPKIGSETIPACTNANTSVKFTFTPTQEGGISLKTGGIAFDSGTGDGTGTGTGDGTGTGTGDGTGTGT